MDLEKIKARAKEGLHYSKWLYVWELIDEVELLRSSVERLTDELSTKKSFGGDCMFHTRGLVPCDCPRVFYDKVQEDTST